MQATLYFRAVHSVHVTRRFFSSRVHCKQNKLDGFEAAISRPITFHGTVVLVSVGQCFFILPGVFYQSISRFSLENINKMPATMDHFARNNSQSKMTCKLCDRELVFRSLNEHLTFLKRHLSNKHPETLAVDGRAALEIQNSLISACPRHLLPGFRLYRNWTELLLLFAVQVMACRSNIVEDEFFGWGFEAGSYSRQQITDQVQCRL